MTILTFIQGLTHKFSKNEIAKSCDLTLSSMQEHTLPGYSSAVTLFTTFKLKSAEAISRQTNFRRLVGGNSGDMVATIYSALLNGQSILLDIQNKSDTLFSDQEASMALTYRKATYLQLTASVNFANDYARKLLNWIYIVETQKIDPEQNVRANLTNAELDYVDEFFQAFCVTIKIMLNDFKILEKSIEKLPDSVVTQLSEQVLPNTMGPAAIDPLGMRNLSLPITISAKWHPMYLLGTALAAFQVASYNASKEELDLLQLRKINLEQLYNKKPDAVLQMQIEYMTERVSRLDYELRKAQEKFSV